jgi:hypothetical protein
VVSKTERPRYRKVTGVDALAGQAAGVHLVVLDQRIDTSTTLGWMFFSILAAIAELEHA